MSVKVVADFSRKSADKWATKGLPPISKTLKSCLLELQQYINESIDNYLGSTTYDNKTIADWIYMDAIDISSPSDEEEFVKVNLFAAKKTLDNIIQEIESADGGLTYYNIRRYRQMLYDFIHDVSGFMDYYYHKTDPSYTFLTGGKSYMTSSFETFMMARGFFYSSLIKKNTISYKESQGMASITIRQSIEIKTKRVLGINKINKTRRKAGDYGFKRLFQFIEDNSADIIYDPIDFEILKSIYRWSCAFIHNGEGSYIWQTETAISYLKPFFGSGSSSFGGKTVTSVFGAFKLKNFNSIKARLDTYVGSDYRIDYLHDNQVEAIIESL